MYIFTNKRIYCYYTRVNKVQHMTKHIQFIIYTICFCKSGFQHCFKSKAREYATTVKFNEYLWLAALKHRPFELFTGAVDTADLSELR